MWAKLSDSSVSINCLLMVETKYYIFRSISNNWTLLSFKLWLLTKVFFLFLFLFFFSFSLLWGGGREIGGTKIAWPHYAVFRTAYMLLASFYLTHPFNCFFMSFPYGNLF